jgi:hypothetical protein
MPSAWTPEEETGLSEYLIQRITSFASGEGEAECVSNYPRDVYFVGCIRPYDPANPTPELLNKLAPVAFGGEFRVAPNGTTSYVLVQFRWTCYYRVVPTFVQQRHHQPVTSPQAQIAPPAGRGRRRAQQQDSLLLRFRKIECAAQGRIRLRISDDVRSTDVGELTAAIISECARATRIAQSDPERIRTDGAIDKKVRVPQASLQSESAFAAFLQSLTTEVIPQWQWDVQAELRLGYGSQDYVFRVEFVNRSASNQGQDNPNTEGFLFAPVAQFSFSGCSVQPFELDLAPKGFRYDRALWGHGFNCAITKTGNEFGTTTVPVFRQMRYATAMIPPARFADLASDPIPVLRTILAAMARYREKWQVTREQYVASSPTWETRHGAEYNRDFAIYEAEIERFKEGLRLIETDSDVLLAFRLTNETFRRGTKEAWRLFQIVFLVTQLGSIAALGNHPEFANQREDVEIIYFPTGGGKTEAYLAVLVFHCFYDRLRGKTAGVTAWTRFPLRLLTLQQTQRVADVIGNAEIVRREQSDLRLSAPNVDGFAVGYFVGEGGSPNELADPARISTLKVEIQVAWSKANDSVARQQWKRVVRCPSCKSSKVTVELDTDAVRLFHKCRERTCAFPKGIIPVFIVDNEIYRHLPSVIVGTIDKLASIGNQRKISQIFGSIDGKCSKHGYYKTKCCQKDCTDASLLQPGIPAGLSGPTLFVQDELHLLKEGLGTFDGHYETFAQQLLRELGQASTLKIIASSATIEAFQRQVSHLYGRPSDRARVFPGLGPTQGESFYASTQAYPQRLYVGVIPHNKTIFNTILELIEFYHSEVERLLRLTSSEANPYGGTIRPSTPEWFSLIDFYRTSLTYFLQNRELNSIRTDLEADVNPKLVKAGFQPVNIRELTGSTSTDDVQSSLETLERVASSTSAPDAVLATSMVSHGVDVDRFNAMIFDGMPRQNAEYIQASSRVGRSHVGIVITCLHPARERDQSHYSYFAKFHEFLGQLVEPVAINRWAKFSIDRTLPGLFMGVLLQLLAPRTGTPDRYYILDFVKRQISAGTLRADDFVPILERAYFLGQPDPNARQLFQNEIRNGVQQFLDQIITAGPDSTFVSDVLIPKPLRSLRDVDEPIDIELDSDGSVWGAASSQQGGASGTTNE